MTRPALLASIFLAALFPNPGFAQTGDSYEQARKQMVHDEIERFGVKNPRVLDSMRQTPRHEFVPRRERKDAYHEMSLPIGASQTISAPSVVAFMTEALDPQPGDVVLEIGTGSGYQAAVLSPLVKEVYTIEIIESLGKQAAKVLQKLNYRNVHVKIGDGYQGWPEHAPFDKIIVTCSPEEVPSALVEQLKEGASMVIPIGERYQQTLYLMRKRGGRIERESLQPTLFVPMLGKAEEQREVRPDPTNPQLENGGFERVKDETPEVIGWHHARQFKVLESKLAPEGKRYALFTNKEPGRNSHALQGFAIDGRQVRVLDVTFHVSGKDVRFSPVPGSKQFYQPGIVFLFYDEKRVPLDDKIFLGGESWRGTFDWRTETHRVDVPSRAREAIVCLGLLGATGELSVDGLQMSGKKN
jgi:protein-L-isoaspartate(D-aspartate) O-methyltransferase